MTQTNPCFEGFCFKKVKKGKSSSAILYRRKFRPARTIGKGATSHVYTVLNTRTKREDPNVVLKVFNKQYSKSKTSSKYLLDELSILSMLSRPEHAHPNIAKLEEIILERSLATKGFVVKALLLENGDMGDLYNYLSFSTGMSMTTEFVRAIFQQLVRAVAHLHRLNIVHSDIKPENILLKSDGRVMLTDFGFAQVVQPAENVAPEDLSSVSASSHNLNPLLQNRHSTYGMLYNGETQAALARGSSYEAQLATEASDGYQFGGLASRGLDKNRLLKSRSTSSLHQLKESRMSRGYSRLWMSGGGGTAEYKAPETHFENRRKCKSASFDGAAADIWALGVVLHVMVCGRLPEKDEYHKANDDGADAWGKFLPTFTKERSLSNFDIEPQIEVRSSFRSSKKKMNEQRKKIIDVVSLLLIQEPEGRPTVHELADIPWVKTEQVRGSQEVVKAEVNKLKVYRCDFKDY